MKEKLLVLTPAQIAVLGFIREFNRENKFPPTRTEISQHFGWRSINAAECHLRALVKKGAIFLSAGKARGIADTGMFN